VLEDHAIWAAESKHALDDPDEHVPPLKLHKGFNPEVLPGDIVCKLRDAGVG
jgi:hypothetical protein